MIVAAAILGSCGNGETTSHSCSPTAGAKTVATDTLPEEAEIIDGTLTLDKVEEDDSAVSVVFVVNEDLGDIAEFKEEKEVAKDILAMDLAEAKTARTPDYRHLEMALYAGKCLRYVYRGNKTGKTVTIEFSNAELQKIANE